MTKANDFLENTFPEIKKAESFSKWISKKQVDFFASVCNLERDSKHKVDGSQRMMLFGETNKYRIHITVSPLNGAGTISIKNKEIIINQLTDEKKEKVIEWKAELEKCLNTYAKMIEINYGEKESEKIFIELVKKDIERLEYNLKFSGIDNV